MAGDHEQGQEKEEWENTRLSNVELKVQVKRLKGLQVNVNGRRKFRVDPYQETDSSMAVNPQSFLLTLYSVSNMSLTARARKSQRAWLNLS